MAREIWQQQLSRGLREAQGKGGYLIDNDTTLQIPTHDDLHIGETCVLRR